MPIVDIQEILDDYDPGGIITPTASLPSPPNIKTITINVNKQSLAQKAVLSNDADIMEIMKELAQARYAQIVAEIKQEINDDTDERTVFAAVANAGNLVMSEAKSNSFIANYMIKDLPGLSIKTAFKMIRHLNLMLALEICNDKTSQSYAGFRNMF